MVLVLAFAIGIIAGLRSMTAPAAVSWAAHLKWLNLQNSPLAFLGSTVAVVCITAFALIELVADKLPMTPNRTTAVGLIARIVTGAFSGVALCAASNQSVAIGAILGGVGGYTGAFAGFHARRYLVKNVGASDQLIAVVEDLVAIGGGLVIVSHV